MAVSLARMVHELPPPAVCNWPSHVAWGHSALVVVQGHRERRQCCRWPLQLISTAQHCDTATIRHSCMQARKSSKVNGKADSTGARLLDNISGLVEAGRVLAIMGPSGSGACPVYQYNQRSAYNVLHTKRAPYKACSIQSVRSA